MTAWVTRKGEIVNLFEVGSVGRADCLTEMTGTLSGQRDSLLP